MSAETKAAGRCACRAVKLLATLPAKGCVHCHCRGCRQVHGAAFMTWFSIPRQNLQISGREHLKWFKDTEYSRRGFCGECGTHMLYMSDRWPGDVHVTLGCIFNDVEIFPRFHLSFNQRVSWFPFEDSLPCLDEDKRRIR
jgi:hypothetical protein